VEGYLRVGRNPCGSSSESAYGDSLSPKEIADLLAYIRSLSK